MKKIRDKFVEYWSNRKLKSFEEKMQSKRQRGAITLSLIVALMPILSFAMFFIDLGRYELAKGIVASSEDLALNSALAVFDGPLLDHMGLMGTANKDDNDVTDPSKIKDNAEKSFKKSVNFSFGDVESILQEATKGSRNGVGSLLGVEVVDVSVDPVAGANLANPAILHGQIVDFMKFRAPINAALKLFDKIKAIGNAAKQAKGNAELMQREKDTLETVEEIYDALKGMYKAIKEYEDLGLTEEYVEKFVKNLDPELPESERDSARKGGVDTYKGRFFKVHNKEVIDLEDTEFHIIWAEHRASEYASAWDLDLSAYPFLFMQRDNYSAGDAEAAFHSMKNAFVEMEKNRFLAEEALMLVGIKEKFDKDKHSKNKYAIKAYDALWTGESLLTSGLLRKFTDSVQDFIKQYNKFDYITSHLKETEPDQITETDYYCDGTSCYEITTTMDDPDFKTEGEKEFAADFDLLQLAKFISPFATTYDRVSTFSYPTREMSVEDHVYYAKQKLWDYAEFKYIKGKTSVLYEAYKVMRDQLGNRHKFELSDAEASEIGMISKEVRDTVDKIDKARKNLKQVADQRNKLEKALKNYRKEKEKWETTVNNYAGNPEAADPALVQDHQEKLGQLNSPEGMKLDTMITQLTPEVLDKFFEHTTNLRDSYLLLKEFANGVKYGNRKIRDFDGPGFLGIGGTIKNKFIDAVDAREPIMPEWITAPGLDSYDEIERASKWYDLEVLKKAADHYFFEGGSKPEGEYYSPDGYEDIHFDEEHNSNPDLNKPENVLYKIIKEYGEAVIEQQDSAEIEKYEGLWDKMKKFRDMLTMYVLPNENPGNAFTLNRGEITSYDSNFGNNSQITPDSYDKSSGQVADLGDASKLSVPAAMRDSLYILDYVMSMFTSDTTRQEAIVAHEGYSSIKEALERREEGLLVYNTDKDLKNSWNKDLRNHIHTNENHFMLGNEIEYILFGHTHNIPSKAHSYAVLFGIRAAMNTIPVLRYVLGNSSFARAVDAFAKGVSVWFPILGEAIVKAAVVFIVTMLETVLDVYTLKAGLSAPFIKYKDNGEDLLVKNMVENLFGLGGGEQLALEAGDAAFGENTLDQHGEVKPTKDSSKGQTEDENGDMVNINDWYYNTYMGALLLIGLHFGAHDDYMARIAHVMEKCMYTITGHEYNLAEMHTHYQIKGKVKTTSFFNIDLGSHGSRRLEPFTYTFEQVKGY